METSRPNIVVLMADQMQARATDPDHPCMTPNIDRIAARGVRFSRAYTPNAVCSPARASLMTGLLPHNHGVLWVTHTVDEDQGRLRSGRRHWAQLLSDGGYLTGYFGKWHVEHTERPQDYGWQVTGDMKGDAFSARSTAVGRRGGHGDDALERSWYLEHAGYPRYLFGGITSEPPQRRNLGIATDLAVDFLDTATRAPGSQPFCCFLSVPEPHDPFICGRDAFDRYDGIEIPVPKNWDDDLEGRPNLYRRVRSVFDQLSRADRVELARCYYASISEIDAQFGRVIDLLEQRGVLDNTIVIVTSDHGELLGAHGMYCKNFSGYEEIYNVPLVMAGPGIGGLPSSAAAAGAVSEARVGTHELYETILDLTGFRTGSDFESVADGRSFRPVLVDPHGHDDYTTGFAEYSGGRYLVTQRVYWKDDWKYVLNGFDYDEMYNLRDDPGEERNLANTPEYADKANELVGDIWRRIAETGDRSLLKTGYPPFRFEPVGPEGTSF